MSFRHVLIAAQRLMELEVQTLTGADHGERSIGAKC
jgi:hypothetical protein